MANRRIPRALQVSRAALEARLRGLDFSLRLIASLVLTFLVLGAGQMLLAAHDLEERMVEARVATATADAQAVREAYTGGRADERPLDEVGEVLQAIAGRPGVHRVRLVDSAGLVVVSSDPAEVGQRHMSATVEGVLGTARSTSGTDAEHGKQGLVEFAAPVDLPLGRSVLEVDQDEGTLTLHKPFLRRQALELMLGGLLIGVPMFFLLGGRTLNRQHRQARDAAELDGLTGLGNHRAFHEELRRTARSNRHSRQPLSLAMVDLDEFKVANDSFGHRHGDALLAEVAGVLREIVQKRPGHRAFRLGGDEFALLLPGVDEREALVIGEDVRAYAARRLRRVTLSIGISCLPLGQGDVSVLLDQADAALYEAKRLGRNRTVAYSRLRGDVPIISPAQVTATRRLIAEGDLSMLFQPILDLGSGIPLGYEALMRPAPTYGFDGPLEAFDVAERIGHVLELDALCRQAALSGARDLPSDTLLFLNLHPRELELDRGDLGETLLRAVRSAGREPHEVVLEITERTEARLPDVVAAGESLRRLGFRLAADDVGEGNSGLELLRRLPVDFVKISRQVVVGALTDRSARAVLHAILAFAHESGGYVIAEGIETRALLDLVQHPGRHTLYAPRGAHGAQGYLLGVPAQLPGRFPAGSLPAPLSSQRRFRRYPLERKPQAAGR